jgi:phytoene desaturase
VFEGATFNLAHSLRQMLYFRPHNRFGGGVYLVGGGTHPGSGLPVIYEGARITARLLVKDLAEQRSSVRAAVNDASQGTHACPVADAPAFNTLEGSA